MTLPSAADLGTIRAADGWRYQITPTDALWLARSAAYEGGSTDATLWSYAQRLVARGRGGTLAELVRSHSQPVNPRWEAASSPGCMARPDQCSDHALEVRLEARTALWESLRSSGQVLAWAQARTPNSVPRATDFARDDVSQAFLTQHPQARLVSRSGRQWYLSEGADSSPRASNDWPANFVSIEYQGRVATASSPWVGPLVAAGLAVVIGAAVVASGAR